jgi:hypothetical protein
MDTKIFDFSGYKDEIIDEKLNIEFDKSNDKIQDNGQHYFTILNIKNINDKV